MAMSLPSTWELSAGHRSDKRRCNLREQWKVSVRLALSERKFSKDLVHIGYPEIERAPTDTTMQSHFALQNNSPFTIFLSVRKRSIRSSGRDLRAYCGLCTASGGCDIHLNCRRNRAVVPLPPMRRLNPYDVVLIDAFEGSRLVVSQDYRQSIIPVLEVTCGHDRALKAGQ